MSLTKNAVASVTQAAIGAIIMFSLYRIILTNLGAVELGVWSAKFVEHARRRVLDFGFGVAVHVHIFMELQERLLRAAVP